MDLKGEYEIASEKERVWEALNNPELLKACIPGCKTLEKNSDTEFSATIQAKVGPVKTSFSGKVFLTNLDPPHSYTISGEGSGGAAGFAKGGADVRLNQEGEVTRLAYQVKAQVGGKLAQLGSRLIQSTAKKLADQFFWNLAGELSKENADGAEENEELFERENSKSIPGSVTETAGVSSDSNEKDDQAKIDHSRPHYLGGASLPKIEEHSGYSSVIWVIAAIVFCSVAYFLVFV